MAAVSVSGGRRSLIGSVLLLLKARARARGRPSRVAMVIQEHLMTFAGLAAVDYAFFHMSHFAGWLAIGISVLLADFKFDPP